MTHAHARFSDAWVIEKVLFDFVMTQGGCICCGLVHSALSSDAENIIDNCSDINTVQGDEMKSKNYFPTAIADSIWQDRMNMRLSLKQIKKQKYEMIDVDNLCKKVKEIDEVKLKRLGIIPFEDIMDSFAQTFNFEYSYMSLLKSLCLQIANFKATKYNLDSASSFEKSFEEILTVKRNAFIIPPEFCKLGAFKEFCKQLQSDHNLPGPESEMNDKDTDLEECASMSDDENMDVPDSDQAPVDDEERSFKSDRRLLRLWIYMSYVNKLLRTCGLQQSSQSNEAVVLEGVSNISISGPEQVNSNSPAVPGAISMEN